MNENPKSDIILYTTDDGKNRIEVRLEGETVWLTQAQMVDLFQTTKQNISLHIKNIFAERELQEDSVVKEYLTTASDRKNYKTLYYNLTVIIAVGYRVKSHRGTQFRIWATERLKEYLVKGFTLDDERLKQRGGDVYFEQLLARIRDIRSSEKVFWKKYFGKRYWIFTQQVLITIPIQNSPRSSLQQCRTKCTGRHTDIPPLK